jgi:hypothetical protein
MLKLKQEALKLDVRALWAAIVVLQEFYEINLSPPIPLI